MDDPPNATKSPLRGRVRPGGRTARTQEAVRLATLAELAEHGFAGLSVEAVAARSGVHKTTIYRRWRTPAALAADALDLANAEPWPVPDTGALREDLRAITAQVVAGLADPVPRALIAAAVHEPEAGRALHAYLTGRHAEAAVAVERAAARGEVPEGTGAVDVVRAAVAPLYYRVFFTGEPADAHAAATAADAAHAAATAGVFLSGRLGDGAGGVAPSAP
ncbi:TetR/AcrR family transcriptional regulator [Actinokineospora guangxiensis]|uniref:TetR/AcrR family transcriptional regulator n=1 Tax=Actinokineospora guangxiensis TaxID=1490288 RepID=A0ABW0ERT6_9PSEU